MATMNMQNSDAILSGFNTTFQKMIEQLTKRFPEDSELNAMCSTAKLGLTLSKRSVMDTFKLLSRQPILKACVAERDVVALRSTMVQLRGPNDPMVAFMVKLTSKWDDLSDNEKDIIWRYVDTLIKLSDLPSL